jgi:hypothetical protein
MIYNPNIWLKLCPKRLHLPNRREYWLAFLVRAAWQLRVCSIAGLQRASSPWSRRRRGRWCGLGREPTSWRNLCNFGCAAAGQITSSSSSNDEAWSGAPRWQQGSRRRFTGTIARVRSAQAAASAGCRPAALATPTTAPDLLVLEFLCHMFGIQNRALPSPL